MFNIKTTGFDALLKRLENAPKNIVELVDGVFENTAKEFVARAKREAPKDTGFLTGEISYDRERDMRFNIVSGSRYAGYLEFGTKSSFVPIPGFEEQAAALRGKGTGDYYEFLNSILDWVKRKGLSSRYSVKTRKALKYTKSDTENQIRIAEAIAWHILKYGIKAQPYFFKQVAIAEGQLDSDLKQIAEQIFD